MQEIYKVDLQKLGSYKGDLNTEKTGFIQGAYKSFSNGYFYNTSDSAIIMMRNKIKTLYDDIEKTYNQIISWLDDYITDINNVDNSLKTGIVSVNDNNTRTYISRFLGDNKATIKSPTAIISELIKNDSEIATIPEEEYAKLSYFSHEKGSMYDYSKLYTLNDVELNWLRQDLGIEENPKIAKTKDELIKDLKDKTGIDYSSSSGEKITMLCISYGIDLQRDRDYGELIDLISQKLEEKEKKSYFGIDPKNIEEDDIEKLKMYETALDYSKYEGMTYDELLKEAEGKIRNAKVYTKEGLIKQLAIKDFEKYPIHHVSDVDLNYMENVVKAAGFNSIEEYQNFLKEKDKADQNEWTLYGEDWKNFCTYVDKSGYYRNWANKNNLTKDQRMKLRHCALNGITDEETLQREVLGIDNRSTGEKILGTLVDFGISFGEGVSSAVEGAADGFYFLGTVVGNYWGNTFGAISEEEYTANIKRMEKEIATDYTKEAYDDIYENSEIGQFAAKNSVDHESVRGFGNSLGNMATNVVGMKGISILGPSGAALAVPFISASGNTLENGYANGGDAGDVLVASLLSGGISVLQYGVAAYVNGGIPYANPTEKLAANVLADSMDAATSVPVETAVQTIYINGYVDQKTGDYHEFTDDMTWGEKYALLFEQNGGFEAVYTTTLAGTTLSLIYTPLSDKYEAYSARKKAEKLAKFNYDNTGRVVTDGIYDDGYILGIEDKKRFDSNTNSSNTNNNNNNNYSNYQGKINGDIKVDKTFNNSSDVQILGKKTDKNGNEWLRVKYYDKDGKLVVDLVDSKTGKSSIYGGEVNLNRITDDIKIEYDVKPKQEETAKYTIGKEEDLSSSLSETIDEYAKKNEIKQERNNTITEDLPHFDETSIDDFARENEIKTNNNKVENVSILEDISDIHSALDEQIEKANYYTAKGNTISIDIESIDSISFDELKKLKKPENVIFRTSDGNVYSYDDIAAYKVIKENINSSTSSSNLSTTSTSAATLNTESNNISDSSFYKKMKKKNGGYINLDATFKRNLKEDVQILNNAINSKKISDSQREVLTFLKNNCDFKGVYLSKYFEFEYNGFDIYIQKDIKKGFTLESIVSYLDDLSYLKKQGKIRGFKYVFFKKNTGGLKTVYASVDPTTYDLTIYPDMKKTDSKGAFVHEGFHEIDRGYCYSNSPDYITAAKLDKNYTSSYARDYAKLHRGSLQEDFGDAGKYLQENGRAAFEKKFPNRANYFKKYFSDLYYNFDN